MTETTAWPCGCKDRGSCERHRRCMYAGCNHRQREIASQIDAAIERLRAEQAEEQARRAELSNVLREPDDEIIRLREEVDVAYAHGVTAGADAERKRLEPEIERLRAALRPFAELALTKTVAHGYQAGVLLTLSNGEKMCAVDPRAILNAHAALE